MDKPIKVSAVLKVTAEFYDPEATPETVRACVEQDLKDAGYEVDVDCVSPDEETFCQYMARNYFPPNADSEKVIDMNGKLALDYLEKCWKEHFGKNNNVPVKWVSVKKKLPDEHPSIFAPWYGTAKWNEAMWRTESERVLVAIKFSDGTRTVDKGKLQEGKWRTGVSPVISQEVTHWALWPEPPEEGE